MAVSDRHEVELERDGESWPYASLMFFGFFGTSTPEGRRLARWTTAATLGLALGLGGLAFGWPSGPARLVWVVLVPMMVVLMAFAYARYLAALDELARLIQLQAFAVAYGFAMLVAAGLYVYALAGEAHEVNGVLAAAMFGLAEVVRGAALAVFARRHE